MILSNWKISTAGCDSDLHVPKSYRVPRPFAAQTNRKLRNKPIKCNAQESNSGSPAINFTFPSFAACWALIASIAKLMFMPCRRITNKTYGHAEHCSGDSAVRRSCNATSGRSVWQEKLGKEKTY